MSPEELVLIAASVLLIGSADVFGGFASRTSAPLAVTAWSQAAGIPVVIIAAVAVGGELIGRDLALGFAAGFGSALGVAALYRGFSVSSVGIVAPVAATTAAAVPIVVGFISGERPSTMVAIGILVAILAIFAVSYVPGQNVHALVAVGHGVASGLGFGFMVFAYAATSSDSGLWSLVVGRTTASVVPAIALIVLGVSWKIARSARLATALAGVLASLGLAAFVAASQTTDLILLGVALGLFPTTTVILAAVFLKDKLVWSQWFGIAGATVAVALISIG
ncbi:MAG: EamA family transporter [Acidimicrobiia bacterium]